MQSTQSPSTVGFVITNAHWDGYDEFVAVPLTSQYALQLLSEVQSTTNTLSITSLTPIQGEPLLLCADPVMDEVLCDVPLLMEPSIVLASAHEVHTHAWISTQVSPDYVEWDLRLYQGDGPYRTIEIETHFLWRVALASASPDRVPDLFRGLAETDFRWASNALHGRFFDSQKRRGRDIAPYLERTDLVPLLDAHDGRVREQAIAAAGRVGRRAGRRKRR